MSGTFSMSDVNKKVHTFASGIFARYVRIVALQKVNKMAMRAALVVMTCTGCADGTLSVAGTTSLSSCVCPANYERQIGAVRTRSILLVPNSMQFSTVANRNSLLTSSSAVWDSTAGPPGSQGALTFDSTKQQWVNGG